ncbi:S-layer homology domain-containing protein [Brevibacillus dissolubilis]|uniref:S-layer homology domain-containing protein n=1 Tax=Brevibacillus dissolubilis TaxID=1844116 RepID=UPI001116F03F|nr:S-layer homology domain-containing protein [Brevibacillus dissolubilis]
MKKLVSSMLATMTLFTIVPSLPAAQASQSFRDVPKSHWAYEAIMEMAEQDVIDGYSDGTFRPNNRITRSEFAKIMIAAADVDMDDASRLTQTFRDVPRSHWAFRYVEYAKPYLTGYKTGSTYTYKPAEDAVREDIAVALVRLLRFDQTQKADTDLLDDFTDEYRISNNLRPYIALALTNKLIYGFNDNTFRPQAAITRAEAAALLYRAKLDESDKVVFPPAPKPEEPKLPTAVTDTFSDDKLRNWLTSQSAVSWGVYSNRVSAYSNNTDIDHYLLPLRWDEARKPKNYELQTDVIATDTDGLGGLYFNGKNGKATLVYLSKNAVNIRKMQDVKERDTTAVATVSYTLQKTNKLKVTVKGDNYYVYVNDKLVYGQQDRDLTGTSLGLYLNKDATKDLPDKATYFDNFSFKVLP